MQVISNAILSFQHNKRCFRSTECLFPNWSKKQFFRTCRCRIKTAKEEPVAFFRSLYLRQYFLSPAFQRCSHLVGCSNNSKRECWYMEECLMPSLVNSVHIPLDLLLVAPFRRREIAIPLDVEKVDPRLRFFVPCLCYRKFATGIRFNADSLKARFSLRCLPRQLHVDFPLQFPFSVHAGQPYGRNTFRQKMGSNQDIRDGNSMLEKIGVAPFVRLF